MMALYRPPALPDPLLQFMLGVVAGVLTLLPIVLAEISR